MGRFLIFVCSPKGNAGLPSAVEEASRVQKIHAASVFGKDDDCTAQQLRDQLQLKPGVRRFLFIGHGDAETPDKRTTLVFTDAEGRLTTVEPDILKELLGSVSEGKGGPLQLVFLNGCCTSNLAERVHNAGVPFVVSWSTVVEDKAATLFSETFFKKLARLDQDQKLTDKDRYLRATHRSPDLPRSPPISPDLPRSPLYPHQVRAGVL